MKKKKLVKKIDQALDKALSFKKDGKKIKAPSVKKILKKL